MILTVAVMAFSCSEDFRCIRKLGLGFFLLVYPESTKKKEEIRKYFHIHSMLLWCHIVQNHPYRWPLGLPVHFVGSHLALSRSQPCLYY